MFVFLIFYNKSFFLPIGANKADIEKYNKSIDLTNQTFTCFDNSRIINLSFVNDGFVDCKDGSDEPGTSHNIDIDFYCGKSDGNVTKVSRWSVNDGICDCCDGSDEHFGTVSCLSTCADDVQERKQIVESLSHIFEDGIEKSKLYPSLSYSFLKSKTMRYFSSVMFYAFDGSLIFLTKLTKRGNVKYIGENSTVPKFELNKYEKFFEYVYNISFKLNKNQNYAHIFLIDCLIEDLRKISKSVSRISTYYYNYDKYRKFLIPIYSFGNQVFSHKSLRFNPMLGVSDKYHHYGVPRYHKNDTIIYRGGTLCRSKHKDTIVYMKYICWNENNFTSFRKVAPCIFDAIFLTPSVCPFQTREYFENQDNKLLRVLAEFDKGNQNPL